MGSENIIKGIDRAIKSLNGLRDRVIQNNLETVDIAISFERDIKPHYKLGDFKPSGFKVEGPEITLITVTDRSDIGKIL
jgi:hypothetical protein